MAAALVDTKLFLPRTREGLVPRPRLDGLLGTGHARLTLVSAPAGFGKTTLVTSWLTRHAAEGEAARRVAWVSLDDADSRAGSFWAYVLTGLEKAAPGTGAAGLDLLGTGQVDAALTAVLNELSVLPDDVTLVLDDYHLADGPEIRPGMAFLVDRLPPQVHLVISTRADPALPLARLRARGELNEVRAADLRFTLDEASDYLTGAAQLTLAADDVAALEARTEGWIASLQLAALSLRGRADPSKFIAEFAGDDRYVVDYLAEEVLDRESPEVRDFLLGTAILERLNGSLCDAVLERSGSSQMLDALDRRNLFVVPLDDRRGWYRYHHLFADVLRAHLVAEQPGRVADLHRRAATWHHDARDVVSAVRHALAADDVDRAAAWCELAMPELHRDKREAVIRTWVDDLPDALVRNRPVLAIGLVGGLMSVNEFEGVEERLRDVERQLALPEGEVVIVDRDEVARIPAAIEMYRAALSLVGGDPLATIAHADRAVEKAMDDDYLPVSAASALAALASWTMGDIDAAHRGYTAAAAGLERIGFLPDVLGCRVTIADLELTQGRLRQAHRTFGRGLELAERSDPPLRGIPDMHVGLAEIARERNDPEAAADHLRRSEEYGEELNLRQNPYRWRVALAGLRQAAGELDSAEALLREAIRVYVADFSPDVRPVPARLARLQADKGDLASARDWARDRGVAPDDELSYLREYEHVTLARILLTEHRVEGSTSSLHDAKDLLDRLLEAADAGGRTGTVIEVLALLALVQHARGDRPGALVSLERALTLTEPEGYVRVFLAEGEPMAVLLRAVAERRPDWAYVRALATPEPTPERPSSTSGNQALVDPLSEREQDVLRLLATDLDGPEIARELVVSLNTVRTHTKHIYTKLGVTNRRSAVSRAHQLDLLGHSRR
jgi:LuxR family maltose regulon positive regulatory protein